MKSITTLPLLLIGFVVLIRAALMPVESILTSLIFVIGLVVCFMLWLTSTASGTR